MASTIFNAPANASMMTNIELAIVQSVAAFVVLALICRHGGDAAAHFDRVLPGGGRWCDSSWVSVQTGSPPRPLRDISAMSFASASELLFFYLVLAIGVQMASQWAQHC